MQHIQSIINESIEKLYNSTYIPEITIAPKPELGEYCINIFPLAKTAWKAPPLIAWEVASELAKYTDIFVSTSATGGYVNFFLTDAVWMEIFEKLPLQREYREAGRDFVSEQNPQSLRDSSFTKGAQKTIVVDYIGANVGKPLHIWHICTPSIGQVICNLYRHLGYRVIGDSHFGDWGGIFGKLIWAWNELFDLLPNEYDEELRMEMHKKNIHFRRWNKEERDNWRNKKLNETWIKLLLALYARFHISPLINTPEEAEKIREEWDFWARKEFQYLSWVGIDLSNPEELKHHEENVELWKKFTSISIAETEKKLNLLNVHATYNIGESFYEWLGLPRPNGEDYPNLEFNMKSIVVELVAKWVATQNEDGSVGVVFSEEMKLPSCILQKKDGTGLYLTSDLAAIKYRLTNGWNPSKLIYSVDVRQQLHLKQAFTIAQMAWPELTEGVEFYHAFNWFIKLKEWAMSTRHGTVIFLEKLIEEGNERTAQILEEKWRTGENALKPEDIQAITVAAIKYSYLAQDREKDVTFDWDKALSFEGNSGPYIQYAYVRARKIISWLVTRDSWLDVSTNDEWRISSFDKSLIQVLARMDAVIHETAAKYKPHILALYCYDVAVTFNSFYVHTPKILEESDEDLKNFRLALIEKTTETLKLGFSLLGIEMPSEM